MPDWWGIPATGVILGLVELAKRLGFPARYAGVLAAGLGALGGVTWYFFRTSQLAAAIVTGLVAGLSAAGLWSTVKNSAAQSGPPAA